MLVDFLTNAKVQIPRVEEVPKFVKWIEDAEMAGNNLTNAPFLGQVNHARRILGYACVAIYCERSSALRAEDKEV